MDIRVGSRAHKSFTWATEICEIFNEDHPYACKFREGTNLCHYVRVIFFYLPLIFLSQIVLWLFILSTVLFFPAYLYGYTGWGKFVLFVAFIIALFLGAIRLYNKAKIWNYARQQKRDYSEEAYQPSQIAILKKWAWAKKSKICPEIRFLNKKEVAQ